LSVWVARRAPEPWVVLVSRDLAGVILVAYVAEHVANAMRGTWTIGLNLPLQFTDDLTVLSILALWRPRPLPVELVYFWALTASLPGGDHLRSRPNVFRASSISPTS
jgi:hypothetical protein